MDGALLSTLARFESTIPPNVQERVHELMREIEQLRGSVIQCCQKSAAASILSLRKTPDKFLPNPAAIASGLLSQDFLKVRDATPAAVQHGGLLISFVHSNLELFAKSVVKSAAKDRFPFVCSSVVPALFGHFLCQESIEAAGAFYTHAFMLARPKEAFAILPPFFCSLPTFRFVEAVMDPFTASFGSRPFSLRETAKLLADSILKCLPLLPSPHLTLFQLMHACEWTQKDISHVFFDLFLVPQARGWILASPFADSIRRVEEILAHVCSESAWALLEAVRFAQSVFRPPDLYRCFDQSFQIYALTAADALTAVEILSQCTEIPYSLDLRAYQDLKKEMLYSPFLIRGFPPSGRTGAVWDSRVIFAAADYPPPPANPEFERLYRLIDQRRTAASVFSALSDSRFERVCAVDGFREFALAQSIADLAARAARFEAYLSLMVHVRALRSWRDVSDRHATVALAAVRSEAISRSLPLPLQRLHVLATKAAEIAVVKARFEQALARLQFFFSGELTKRECAAQRRLGEGAATARVFRQIVQELMCLERAELQRRFDIMARALRKGMLVDQSMEVMLDAMAVTQGTPFIESFLILTAHVVKYPDFSELLPDVDLHNWTKFEHVLVHAVSESESKELREAFFQTQAQIEEFLTARIAHDRLRE
jgi:hypothetical protein